MGKMKERHIELMDSGVSNLYTVVVVYDSGLDKDEYEYTDLKTALMVAHGFRLMYHMIPCSIYVHALHLRTMRERWVKRTGEHERPKVIYGRID